MSEHTAEKDAAIARAVERLRDAQRAFRLYSEANREALALGATHTELGDAPAGAAATDERGGQ